MIECVGHMTHISNREGGGVEFVVLDFGFDSVFDYVFDVVSDRVGPAWLLSKIGDRQSWQR